MTLQLTTTVHEDGSARLSVAGEIDMATAEQFRRALADAVDLYNRLVLDLTAVGYLDSSGIRVLYEHVDSDLELVIAPGSVIGRALTITGLHRLLAIRTP